MACNIQKKIWRSTVYSGGRGVWTAGCPLWPLMSPPVTLSWKSPPKKMKEKHSNTGQKLDGALWTMAQFLSGLRSTCTANETGKCLTWQKNLSDDLATNLPSTPFTNMHAKQKTQPTSIAEFIWGWDSFITLKSTTETKVSIGEYSKCDMSIQQAEGAMWPANWNYRTRTAHRTDAHTCLRSLYGQGLSTGLLMVSVRVGCRW